MTGTKIISGGQTGVDRAALDVALELGIPCGGWCPKGRLAEDGTIPDKYPLAETTSRMAVVRTQKNVLDSDATLVLTVGEPFGGTKQTIEFAREHRRPHMVVDLDTARGDAVAKVRKWIAANSHGELNVAGPRESQQPGIYAMAAEFLRRVVG